MFANQLLYATVPTIDIPRSVFDLSHTVKLTFDSDYIIPIYCDEVLPGDTFQCTPKIVARLNTLLHPLMDTIWLETASFYVPDRLLWDNFKRMMGEKPNIDSSIDFSFPVINTPVSNNGYDTHSLSDYIGLPVGVDNIVARAAWHRAYYKIFNEWFRDQNLQSSLAEATGSGPDAAEAYVLQKVNKISDMFTRALPLPQEGNAVTLPLGVSATVYGTGNAMTLTDGNVTMGMYMQAGGGLGADVGGYNDAIGTHATPTLTADEYHAVNVPGSGISNLYADLSTAVGPTVNELREAFAMQRVLELLARGGHRYIELVANLYRTICPDFRAQRSEYLGGSKQMVSISSVEQTAPYTGAASSFLGDLGARGVVTDDTGGWRKSFVEHGVIMTVMWVRAENSYDRGIDAKFNRRTRFDVYMPPLAFLGEQPIQNQEIYAQGTSADTQTFGFREAWMEYRSHTNRLCGLFRHEPVIAGAAQGSLNSWHVSQDFDALPALNSDFITSAVPLDRCVAVPSQPHFNAEVLLQVKATRPIPARSIPGGGTF